MDGPVTSPHRMVNPPELLTPAGFSHACVPVAGRTIYLAGQTAHAPDGTIAPATMAGQMDRALANTATALRAAGAQPEHLVSMQLFVTSAAEYRDGMKEIGEVWRKHLGRHYPAVSLFEIRSLFDPAAKVEIVSVAVIPEGNST